MGKLSHIFHFHSPTICMTRVTNPFPSNVICSAPVSELKSTLVDHTMCHKSALGGDRAGNGFLNAAVSTLVTLLIISLCTTSALQRKTETIKYMLTSGEKNILRNHIKEVGGGAVLGTEPGGE